MEKGDAKMTYRTLGLTTAICLTILAGQSAFAVSLDGSIDEPGDEYNIELTDPTAPADGDMADDLDVDGIFFDLDASFFYFGLSTVDPIDTDGDESIFSDGETHVALGLDFGGGNFYTLRIEFAGGAVPTLITLKDGGSPAVDISGSSTVAVGDDLEVAIDTALLPGLATDFSFVGRLDGTGIDNDDVFFNDVTNLPEPASLALMGVGLAMMIKRKR